MILNLLSYLKLVFILAIKHRGWFKVQEQQGYNGDQQTTTTTTTNYVLLIDEMCPSPVPVPVHVLTKLIKKRLPVVSYTSFLKRMGNTLEDDEESMCPVCLDCIKGNDEIRVLCNCSHVFHRHCLDSWVDVGEVNCPSCMSMMFPNKMGPHCLLGISMDE